MAESFQLINGKGDLKYDAFEGFARKIGLHGDGRSYGVVSIIGPQSGGKSTLLNHLFKTSFKMMDATKGTCQTTQGIWMARSVGKEPLTMIIDVEGSDGQERKDDTIFEKQSALFALATSDILLLNLKCDSIGQMHGAGIPLLRTVIEVMTRLVNNPRKTTLMFVLRDKNETPVWMHEQTIQKNVKEIWDSVKKLCKGDYARLSHADVFNVEVVALTHYRYDNNVFIKEVAELRNKICGLIRGGGESQRDPFLLFVPKLKEVWDKIKKNEDLNLPSISVLASSYRCEEIAKKSYNELTSNWAWVELKNKAQTQLVMGFGDKLSSIIKECMKQYDEDAGHFDDEVKSQCKRKLEKNVLELVRPAYQSILDHLRRRYIEDFKINFDKAIINGKMEFAAASEECKRSALSEFDKGCADAAIKPWYWASREAAIKDAGWEGSSKERQKLESEIKARVTTVKSNDVLNETKKQLKKELKGAVVVYLNAGDDETWPLIRQFLRKEMETAEGRLSRELDPYGIDRKIKEVMLADLKKHAHDVVESKSRELSSPELVLEHMKYKFDEKFQGDIKFVTDMKGLVPSSDNINEAAFGACMVALKLLAVRAAIRLDDNSNDDIESILVDTVRGEASLPSNWAKVPASNTLLKPKQCEELCLNFVSLTTRAVDDAIARKGLCKAGGMVATAVGGGALGVAVAAAVVTLGPAAVPLAPTFAAAYTGLMNVAVVLAGKSYKKMIPRLARRREEKSPEPDSSSSQGQ